MTFPTEDHPLFCPQSGGPGDLRSGGCPRCGRIVGSKEGMAGLPWPYRRHTLLPHLRFRPMDALDDVDRRRHAALEAHVWHLAEPIGHRGASKHGRWRVAALLNDDPRRPRTEVTIVADDLTQAEAFARMDELNGWPVVDGMDLARHLAIWHDDWLDFGAGDLMIERHTQYHTPRGTPHVHTEEHDIAVLLPRP